MIEGKKPLHVRNEVEADMKFLEIVHNILEKNGRLVMWKPKYKLGEHVSMVIDDLPVNAVVKKAEAGVYLLHADHVDGDKEAVVVSEDLLAGYN